MSLRLPENRGDANFMMRDLVSIYLAIPRTSDSGMAYNSVDFDVDTPIAIELGDLQEMSVSRSMQYKSNSGTKFYELYLPLFTFGNIDIRATVSSQYVVNGVVYMAMGPYRELGAGMLQVIPVTQVDK